MSATESRAGDKLPSVVFVLRRLDIGGTEKHVTRVLPELRRHGINASLYLLERGGSLEATLTAGGVSIFGPRNASGGVFKKALGIFTLRAYLRQLRPDVVHFFLPEAYVIGTLAALL